MTDENLDDERPERPDDLDEATRPMQLSDMFDDEEDDDEE